MAMLTKNTFAAWDNIFTVMQIKEICNMSLHATLQNAKLHDLLRAAPPVYKMIEPARERKKGIRTTDNTRSPEKPCEEKTCSGTMELFSVCCSESALKKQGYFTKWECNRCGKVEYNKQTIIEIKKNFLMGI